MATQCHQGLPRVPPLHSDPNMSAGTELDACLDCSVLVLLQGQADIAEMAPGYLGNTIELHKAGRGGCLDYPT